MVVYVSSNSLKCGSKNVIIENHENHTFIFLNAAALCCAGAHHFHFHLLFNTHFVVVVVDLFAPFMFFLYLRSPKICEAHVLQSMVKHNK